MTSAARRTSDRRRRRAFTILEMVLVLSLFMLVIGGGVAALYFNRDEARLNDAIGEIELLAKRARTLATLQQRPYALEFTTDGVAMMTYAEASIEPKLRDDLIEAELLAMADGVEVTQPIKRDAWRIEEDMQLLIRRWSTGTWAPLKRGDSHVWRFDPRGISEPIGVRIETEGGSWIASLFHPLTAGVTETESEIQ